MGTKDDGTLSFLRGVDFVGFVFYRGQTLMRKSIKRNFARKCAKLNKLSISAKNYRVRVSPWLGWAKYSDSRNLLRKLAKGKI